MAGRAGKPIRRVPAGTRVPSSLSACGRASHPRRLLCIRPMTLSCGGQRRWRLLARARLVWMKQLDSRQRVKASQLAKVLAVSRSVIQPSDALRATSMQLEDRYDLRAPDSFRLAAALEWCEYTPQGRIFLTADQRLRDAALLGSFDVKQA